MTVKPHAPLISPTSASFAGLLSPRTALVDDVYEALKSIIMDHVIKPGERVSIDRLSREMSVSPTPIREALARLEAERLVVKEPLKGYRTTELLTRPEINELFELRSLIEPWAAAKAATSINDELRGLLIAEIQDLGIVPDGDSYNDYRQLAAHDRRLHGLIAKAAGNQRILGVFESMHVHLHLFRLHYGQEPGRCAVEEHHKIAAAILDGDPAEAESAMEDHLSLSLSRLLPSFDEQGIAKVREQHTDIKATDFKSSGIVSRDAK